MTHVLHIDSSANLTCSVSRAASAAIVRDLKADTVTRRDLATEGLPFITEKWADARLIPTAKRTAEEKTQLAHSDALVAELQAADILVIGVPLYNFGLPASLKAWIDLVARPQLTFRYTETGPEGLLTGKKAIVTFASGGVPMGSPQDFATPHLRQVLNFLGIDDVTILRARDVANLQAA